VCCRRCWAAGRLPDCFDTVGRAAAHHAGRRYCQSRPDYVGGETTLSVGATRWCNLNKAAFRPGPDVSNYQCHTAARHGEPIARARSRPMAADISIGKSFQITESVNLQVRATRSRVQPCELRQPGDEYRFTRLRKITSAAGWRTGQVSGRITF